MTSSTGRSAIQMSKFKLSRRTRKLLSFDDQRFLAALPKDVPERTWAEILQRDENDLLVFDIREEIIEEALRIGYEHYMEKQNTLFTVHCVSQACLKLIDWYFYRHDPGEEPSAYPPSFIPNRLESWTPDELPAPSPKDSWAKQDLPVLEEIYENGLQKWPSTSSIEYPVVEDIPEEFWFPGRVNLPIETESEIVERTLSYASTDDSSKDTIGNLVADSEVLQKITDYSSDKFSRKSSVSSLKVSTPAETSLHGGGDASATDRLRPKRKSKTFSRPSLSVRSRAALLPAIGDSCISVISDCRLRNLRLDTQYEISSEKLDTPPGVPVKRR